ncbi:MAG: hypothetical protein M3Z57_08820 [Candidatus Dormibacteraeota bacterium]|nr:hypothetical protein [Candidatus Dormibacteraeota bacterium]
MNGWKRRASQLVGGGSALYGLSVLALPGSLAKQLALDDPTAPASRLLAITFGVRDLVSGVSILGARNRDALRAALLLRGIMDGGDAIACALLLSDRGARARAVGVAGTWAVLSFGVATMV